jgi:hypothetical protein
MLPEFSIVQARTEGGQGVGISAPQKDRKEYDSTGGCPGPRQDSQQSFSATA